MHKNKNVPLRLLPAFIVGLGLSPFADAEIMLYDKDETTFSTDGYINAFYVNSDVDRAGDQYDRRQSRVKMGFLPNYLGFNMTKQVDDLKLGARASFWVTINDSETNGTDTAIDVRQFYGTVANKEWGEVLIGKDFGLFARSNILLTHAYDQLEVVAGAGTLGREIEQQGGLPDAVLVSVGGGGLIGGLAGWFGQRSRVVALEPERAPTLFRAREAGHPVDVEVGGVAADSLGAKRIGDFAWDITQREVRDALLLSDEAIRAAQLWLWKEMKLAVEPAAALPLAALQTGAYVPRAGEKVCLIVCGANLDPASLA